MRDIPAVRETPQKGAGHETRGAAPRLRLARGKKNGLEGGKCVPAQHVTSYLRPRQYYCGCWWAIK